MDAYEFENLHKPKRKRSARLLNFLTLTAILGVLFVSAAFMVIYKNPYSFLNPFPPPALPVLAPTATATSIMALPPTWTPLPTLPPTATETARPTATIPPTPTPFTLLTLAPTPTAAEPPNGYPFDVQTGSPVAIANIYHPELGCDWMGVGGQAVDMSGAPVTGLIIRLGGSIPGINLPAMLMNLTGVALNYGRGGYEFTLADHPIASKQSAWVQLLDQSNLPLSPKVYFNTYEDCSKNLIIVNFKQVR